MKRVGSFVGDWWRLVIPYFKSEEWPIAVVLLIGAIALTFSSVGLEVLFNDWNRRFYDSIQNKNEEVFWREIKYFSVVAGIWIAVYIARAIVSPYLRLRWRRWLTRRYLAHWLDDRGYYRIELQRSVDNVDQRIAEDLNQLGQYSMTLLLGLLGAVATLISFIYILWELSGPLSLKSIGIDAVIPGYMAWVCVVYAIGGTFLANLVGRRLIPLNFQKQRFEANFRFSLVRVRENAEGIALYGGEEREADMLNARFADVFANGWRVLFTQAQLAFYQGTYGQLAIIFPYVVTAPRFFAGAITFGVMTQTASAFGQVQTALSFFIDNYTSLAELRAVMDRLKGLQEATDHKPATAIEVAPAPAAGAVTTENLTLSLPNGQSLLENLQLVLPGGRSTLVWGASGTGKSTLFRALAGIWPFGHGQVRVPAGARVLFLPQKPYIPIGTLRDAVKYPDEHSAASDGDIRAALQGALLGHLVDRLDEEAHWANTLSGGEQQRLAIARALVFKPDWLFMDEATSSLDEPAAEAVYRELKTRLPGTTMVSIGHSPALKKWHDRTLELQRQPGEVGRLSRDGSNLTQENTMHHAPEFKHPDDMDWEMGRFRNVTKFLFHPTPERPTVPNIGFLRYEPGAGFPFHKHDFAQIWYVIEGEFQMGDRKYGPGTIVYMEDPHFENEMRTETGGTVLFVQYPGPTTGGRPIYEGRMNLKAVPPPEQLDLEH